VTLEAPLEALLFQGFTPSRTSLARVDLRLRAGGSFPAGGYTTVVNIRQGTTDGPILGTSTTLVSGPVATGAQLDIAFVFPTKVVLVPGQVYVIEWKTPVEGDRILTWMARTGNPYPGGTAYGCPGASIPDDDFVFTTYSIGRSCP
jgi:hypothetical protein